ncbi:MAG: hypothetical protein EOP09_02080 [Proteobacteria bacterium]|nr:MAG: hypothetical protein EOP09_02080 [Pseudomonadota bacterium]
MALTINLSNKDSQRSQSGQATLEYVLVLFLVVIIFSLVGKVMQGTRIVERMMGPLKQSYGAIYKYGHVKAKGPDEGGTAYHPQALYGTPGRIFINPQR